MVRLKDERVLCTHYTTGDCLALEFSGGITLSLPKNQVDSEFYNTFKGGLIQTALTERGVEHAMLLAVFNCEKLVYPVKD